MDYFYGKNVTKKFVSEKLFINNKTHDEREKTTKKYVQISDVKQNICYICKSKKKSIIGNISGVNYVKCTKCNHAYTEKRLSLKNLNKFYSQSESWVSNYYNDKKLLKLREDIVRPKLKLISKYAKGKNWLDIGSADGSSIQVLEKEGFNATGLELSKNSVKFAREFRNIELLPCDLDEFSRTNTKKWNVISMFCILEHVLDPIKTLEKSNRLLSKNGIIAIEVPNFDSISSHTQLISKNIPDRHLLVNSHIMLFTEKSLTYALNKSGFEPIALWYFGMDTIELFNHLGQNRIFKDFFAEKDLTSLINSMQRSIDTQKLSDGMLMIARKIR
jgi:2-polyprenyl-3-methyl-5-hydroxy-6-metoxy-1,4-benzoquinol methylase